MVLALVLLCGCLSSAFCANAAEALPLDGEVLQFTMAVPITEKKFLITVGEQGKIDLCVTADAAYLAVRLFKSGECDKFLFAIDGDSLAGADTCTKETEIYLAPGEYTLKLEHSGEVAANVSVAANFSAISTNNITNFPANKNVSFFLGEWEEFVAYRVVVKKDYRLKFTIYHNFPIGMLITDANEKLYYVSSEWNATFQKPKTETVNICLKKGTYFFAIANIAQEYEDGSGIGSVKMEVNPYIAAPDGFKVITRKTTSQTVSYNAVKGVAGYQVQCSDGGTQWAQTKTGTSLSCCFKGLTPGGTYKFRVRSYIVENGKKVYGAWSKTLCSCAKPADTQLALMPAPKGKIIVMWDIQNQYELLGYQIWYATDSKFKNVVKKADLAAPPSSPLAYSYKSTGFKSGKTYYVKIRKFNTFNGVSYYGAWSNAVKVKVK